MDILCGVTSDQFSDLGVSLGQSIVLLAVVDNYIKTKHEQPDVRPKTTFKTPAAPDYKETVTRADRMQDPQGASVISSKDIEDLSTTIHGLHFDNESKTAGKSDSTRFKTLDIPPIRDPVSSANNSYSMIMPITQATTRSVFRPYHIFPDKKLWSDISWK